MVLALALVWGMFYLALVPPWQHYDEPTHFEYAWLIAHRRALPRPGDYDPAMRREVAASMLEHNFFGNTDPPPNLLAQDEPVWIGISELGHPPLYYLLLALPLRLLSHADVVFQLYAARTLSLLLYLLSVWVAGRLVGELTPQGHALRWMVPVTVALLPAYIDLMTAVNNDVGATALFSLFLWGAVRMILRGLSFLRLIWLVGAAALCVWTKSTAAVAVLLAPLVLALALFRRPWRGWRWATLLAVIGLVLGGAVFSWGDAAFWYRSTAQASPTRQEASAASLGQAALALETTAQESGRQIVQPLRREDLAALRGQTVTLGAWMWATAPVQVRSPMLYDGQQATWQSVEVGAAPAFHAITATVSADADRVEVILRPWLNREQGGEVTIFYDGVVLVEGGWPLDRPPVFNSPGDREGMWGGRPFFNRVQNGSAETAWPRVRPRAEEMMQRYTRRSPTQFLASLLDWRRTGWVYRASSVNLLQSFWARFGWNHVGLAEGWYWGLGLVTVLGLVGALAGMVRLWRARQSLALRRAVSFLAVTALLVWGSAFLRSHPLQGNAFIPGARYAYPVIVPTVLALAAGWLALARRQVREMALIGVLSGLMLLNVVSLTTIALFYYGR